MGMIKNTEFFQTGDPERRHLAFRGHMAHGAAQQVAHHPATDAISCQLPK